MEAASLYPEAFAQAAPKKEGPAPQSGFLPSAKAGLAGLKADVAALAGRTGLMDEKAAEQYIKEQEEYRRKTFKPTETWSEAPVTKGLELFGGSLPYMAAPLAAGVGAAALPLTGAAATAAGLGATGLASLAQFTGSNLSRQMDEGKTLGQTELGAAAAAAVPQAALDVLSFKMMPGIRNILAAGGKEVSEKTAVEIAKQGTAQIAKDYAAATGKAMGAEGLTEAGQQFFERLQAGLSLTDAKARDEYWDSLIGGAVLGGGLAPVGRYVERGGIAKRQAQEQRDLDAKAAAEQQRLADIEAAQREEFQKTPEYLDDVRTRYDDLVGKLNDLKAATKIKPEGTDPASQQIAAEQKEKAVKELKDFQTSDEFRTTVAEYIKAKPLLTEADARRKATESLFGKEDLYTQEDVSPTARIANLQSQIADLKKQQAKKGMTLAEQQPLQNRINALEEELYGAEQLYGDKTAADPQQVQRQITALEQQYQRLSANKFASQDTLRNLRDRIQDLKLQPVGGMPSGLVPTQAEIDSARTLLTQRLEDAQSKITTDFATADLERHNASIARYEDALKKLDVLQKSALKEAPRTPSLFELQDQMDTAQQQGDVDAVRRLTPMLAEAEKQGQLPFDTGYASENQLAAEIAQGREEAARRRETVEKETNALLRMGERPLTPFALGRREATLREAREALREATKKTGRTVSKGTAYQVVDGKLGAATEVSKLVRRNEQDWSSFGKEKDADMPRKVQEREALRKELKDKLAELEADYAQFVQPSPALQKLHQTYTDAIKQTLADVEKKLQRKTPEITDVNTTLMTASDQRVADLIDRLLGPATGGEKVKPTQATLFDLESQKKAATEAVAAPGATRRVQYDEEGFKVKDVTAPAGRAAQVRGELPIEQAQRLMEESQSLRAQLDELNQQIKAAGQMPDIDGLRAKLDAATTEAAKNRLLTQIQDGLAKIARVQDLKNLRDSANRLLNTTEQQRDRLSQMQTPTYTAQETAPTTADLFGGLEEARTEQNKVQDVLDRLYDERATLRADLQRRGQLGATPQLQALVEQYSKDTPRLRQVEDEIEKQEAELERVSGKRSARFEEFAQAREAERVAEQDTQTRTLPGFERRAGVRPVDEQKLREARTELVALQNTGEELRKVQASQDPNPTRYLRQLAAMKQEQYEAFLVQSDDPIIKTWPAQKLTNLKRQYPKTLVANERDIAANDALRKQIKYLENIMRGGNRRNLDQAVQDNLAKQDQARARIAELESRQRAYEQQEAVRTGAAPGTAEARRLVEGAGYRTFTGDTRKAPKKLESWGITAITKKNATPVAPAKVAATANMVRQYQKETEAAATTGAFKQQTLQMQLRKATANIEKLNNALQQVYPTSVANTTEKEITDLLAAGMTPEARSEMRDMAQVYANLKNSVAGNTVGDVIARLEALKAELVQQSQRGGRFTPRRGGVELYRNEVEEDIAGKKATNKRTEASAIQDRIADLTQTIKHLMAQQKTADPWTSSFNALIEETNAKALLASQEIAAPAEYAKFAQLEADSEKRKLDSFLDATQKRIAEAEQMPDSAQKTELLAELNYVSERQFAGLPVEPRDVADMMGMTLSDVQRRYEFGAYNAQLAAYNKAVEASNAYQEQYERAQQEYQKARVEQLSLLKAYGNDLQTNINTEVEKIQTLTPQLEEQAKENAENRAQLQKANQALAKTNIEARKKAAETVPSQTAGMTYSAQERAALQRLREGLGLPGARYETDTTSALVVKTKAAIRQTLALEQAKLDKARAADDVATVQEQTLRVQELQQAFESVQDLGERVVTPVGVEDVERTAVDVKLELVEERKTLEKAKKTGDTTLQNIAEKNIQRLQKELASKAPEEGARLGRRRVGPVARVGTQPPGQMLSGTPESREAISKGNRPMQIGTQRLTAADMDPQSASAVSLAVLKQQLDAATGDRKTQLQEAYTQATDGMTEAQITEKIKEGEDLIKVPGAATVVAAREQVRAANAALAAAKKDYAAAAHPAAKEIAQDSVDMAQEALDRAYAKLEAAQNAVAVGFDPNIPVKTQSEKAIQEGLQAEEAGGGQFGEDLYDDSGVAMQYTTATRTESNPATQEAIKDGRFMEAVERLAVDSDNPLLRETANDIRRLLMRTKVVIDPNLTVDGKEVPAAYDPSTNTVKFRSEAITDEDIIHEGVHAVTLQVLRTPDEKLTPQQRNAKREITAIYNAASKRGDLKTEYGITDVEEFVSEMQSNSEFRAAVDNKPWYQRFWHALTRLFSRKPIEKISDQASALIKQLYLPSTNVVGGKQAPSVFRGAAMPKSALIGYEPGVLATLKGNFFGLAGRVQHFDRLAAADAGIVAAEGAGKLSSTEAFNAQYFMRMGENVTQAAGQFITSGPVRIVADKRSTGTEYRYESTTGANLVNVSEQLELMAKAANIDAKEAERMATMLLAGDRANATTNGWERLMTDPAKRTAAIAEYKADVAFMKSNPAAKQYMDALTREYKQYNDNLLDFTVDCGFMSKDEAARLKKTPYVPFYRIENGVVKLYTGTEHPIRIGNIKENPDLARFLGDTQTILPLLTSAVQNTFMLTRSAMNNKSTLETTNALYKAGFVSKSGKGPGLANADTVHYKIDGVDHFATIDSDTFGIPAHLIVKGMEGIKTTIPALVQVLGMPANLVRKFVVRSPAYVVRQLIREPINAFLQSGIDGVPVVNALKQMANMRAGRSPEEAALMRGLVVSSNVYTGDRQDMTKFLNDIAAGRSGWDKFLGRMDTIALQADTATRAIAYKDALDKGLSEAKAQFRALELQNFSRRGLSPSMQVLSTLIPFFNAQIQGLDVLQRSLSGKMPFAKEMDIQRKIKARTAMLSISALAYAIMMQDDEEYKKATPAERYGNVFVPVPGSKDKLKIPMGFELGTLTMGLVQSVVDTAMGDTKAKDAIMGLGKVLANSAPSVIPAAAKPVLEAVYGSTLQGSIESQREKMLEAEKRFRSTTTEAAKALGGFTGMFNVSPIMLEHLVRGYTGSLGLSLLAMANPLLRSSQAGEQITTPLSKTPFVSGLFQTADGRFILDRAYEYMDEVIKAQQTYKDMVARGQLAEAKAFAQQRANLLVAASAAGGFRESMGNFFAQERAIRDNPRLSQARKEELLEKLKIAENRMAQQFYSLSDRTRRQ